MLAVSLKGGGRHGGARPHTANTVVTIDTANTFDNHVDPSKLRNVQMRQFGEDQKEAPWRPMSS